MPKAGREQSLAQGQTNFGSVRQPAEIGAQIIRPQHNRKNATARR